MKDRIPAPISLAYVWEKLSAETSRFGRRLSRIYDRNLHGPLHWIKVQHFRASPEARKYRESRNSFALYRILGNDLPPRHKSRQTLENLRFILENEPVFENCEKWWVVNRIFDPGVEREVIELLEAHKQHYFCIPFLYQEYAEIGEDFSCFDGPEFFSSDAYNELDTEARERALVASLRLKNLYAMNNNGARNAALEHGRGRAKWVLPWDGNCFLSQAGWDAIVADVTDNGYLPYHIVPMARATDNVSYLSNTHRPVASDEPQIIFHNLSQESFNPEIPYGRRPKVELLCRLNVAGNWMSWRNDPWEIVGQTRCSDAWRYQLSRGWVGRLSSGEPSLEVGRKSSKTRMRRRNEAIVATLKMLDETQLESHTG